MKVRCLFFFVLFIIQAVSSWAANLNVYSGTAAYNLSGGFLAPFGELGDYFRPGPGGAFTVNYSPAEDSFLFFPDMQHYYLSASISYGRFSVEGSPLSSLDLVSVDAGPVFYLPLFRYWVPCGGLSAGMFYERIKLDALGRSENRVGPTVLAHAGFIVPITTSLSVNAEALYRFCYQKGSSLHATGVMLSFSYNFSGDYGNRIGANESAVKIIRKETRDIFAIRFAEYNAEGIGMMTIRNESEEAVYNVAVEFDIQGITGSKTSIDDISSLMPGEVRKFRIPVTLSPDLLSQSNDRDSRLKCTVVYSTRDSRYYYTENAGILVYSRNAILWDETARLGSFIMPKNNAVASFVRKVISSVTDEQSEGVPRTVRDAAVLFDALHTAGFTYVSDPSSGYAASSANRNAVDYVQLPAETMERRGGDCDDLTVLYASMLESAGIATAIATIPGHVFVLFNTRISESTYFRVAGDRNLFLVKDGMVWVPVEVTRLKTSFMEAWRAGAGEIAASGFEMLETVDAWDRYPSTDGGDGRGAAMPDMATLRSVVRDDFSSILKGSIEKKSAELIAAVTSDPKDYRLWGALGSLYGIFGMLDKADDALDRCLEIEPSFDPALVNKGNISLLRRDYETAAVLYKKATAINARSYSAYLNLALMSYERKRFREAEQYYEKAVTINPLGAMRYKYLTRTYTRD